MKPQVLIVCLLVVLCLKVSSQTPLISSNTPSGVHCESMTARFLVSLTNGTISEMGIIYGTNSALVSASTISSLTGVIKVSRGIGTGVLGIHPVELADLSPSTTYYYKAYATNENGTSYGSVVTQATSAACAEYYSCSATDTWDTDPTCSSPGDVPTSSSICYMRHDWSNTSFNYAASINLLAFGHFSSVLPYRMVVQSGGVVFQNAAFFTAGFQLEVQSGGVYGHNGSIDLDAGVTGKITQIQNEGAVILVGSFTNNLTLENNGDFCVTGIFQNQATEGASVNGISDANMTSPTDYFTDATYGGGDGTPCLLDLTPLPVEIVSFSVFPLSGNQARLKWTTASEINSSHFNIYSSSDGINWKIEGHVISGGNSIEKLDYEFDVLNEVNSEITFYKLTETDIDGFESEISIKNILWSVNEPTITFDRYSKTINVINPEEIKCDYLTIRNASGQLVFKEKIAETTRFKKFQLPAFSKGVYFLELHSDPKRFTSKIIF